MRRLTFNRRVALGGVAAMVASTAYAQGGVQVRHHGVLIRTPDLDAALAFYADGLGFALAEFEPGRGWARFAANMPLYLEVVGATRLHPENVANSEITFQSNDLDASIGVLQSAGARLTTNEPYATAVGRSIRFADHAGVIHHMMHSARPTPLFAEPRIYNCGFDVPAAAIAPTRSLLEGALGFVAMTERYFPPSVPYLETDRSFAFMLHHNQDFEPDLLPREALARDDLGVALVFTSTDLRATAREAAAGGAVALDRSGRGFSLGQRMSFATPGGAPFEIWQWT
jgi:predicted enzyme related to lactoylglutathione lyase